MLQKLAKYTQVKRTLTLLLLAVGINLEKLSKVVLESRRPRAVFYNEVKYAAK